MNSGLSLEKKPFGYDRKNTGPGLQTLVSRASYLIIQPIINYSSTADNIESRSCEISLATEDNLASHNSRNSAGVIARGITVAVQRVIIKHQPDAVSLSISYASLIVLNLVANEKND